MFNLQTIGENFIPSNGCNMLGSMRTKNVNSSFVLFIILKCAKCSEHIKYDEYNLAKTNSFNASHLPFVWCCERLRAHWVLLWLVAKIKMLLNWIKTTTHQLKHDEQNSCALLAPLFNRRIPTFSEIKLNEGILYLRIETTHTHRHKHENHVQTLKMERKRMAFKIINLRYTWFEAVWDEDESGFVCVRILQNGKLAFWWDLFSQERQTRKKFPFHPKYSS